MEEKIFLFNISRVNTEEKTAQSAENTLEVIIRREDHLMRILATIQGEVPYEYPIIEQCISIIRSELESQRYLKLKKY